VYEVFKQVQMGSSPGASNSSKEDQEKSIRVRGKVRSAESRVFQGENREE